ncbi:MAG: UDP-N-acetylmuramoyl-tripeptide--D-alanyl-D-alanine ligase [Patescibacteria group bacterium]|nr:UDP-N-acetylmuramoyl-tripeptide--D-alanyl-D-alanine ligase [Patescibacteria group bacterium]
MKKYFKNSLISLFKILTSLYLKKNKIEVIAVTGSAGKTTTKNTIAQLLEDKITYVPMEDYNTEIGIPLSIFKEKLPGNIFSLKAWLTILWHMKLKLLFKKADYHRIVLEMGADHPGDIKYLTSFVRPKIAVVTTVLPVHTENFNTVADISTEKSQILTRLREKDVAILNYDDDYVKAMKNKTRSHIIWVGQSKKADLWVDNINLSLTGMTFDLHWKGENPLINMQLIAPQLLISLLSALAVCLYLGEDLSILVKRLENIRAQPGRMNLIPGMNGSIIIDDSYNANPSSVVAALGVLDSLPGRKIAVLGNMNELGGFEKDGHIQVGKEAAKICDIVVLIGSVAEKYIKPEVLKKINNRFVKSFETPYQAGEYLETIIQKNDIILVKGSQNKVFAEETVKIIMSDPGESSRLLVRQTEFWQNKKKETFRNK